ncbi:hypothetical protein PYW07_002698 [Mythimna separata]|uniref:unspecific monooxygenase n=1 Tax=Mythimna separata TaxID=271217 RepID=A0AAD8DQR8_MYTSE|nr:hypothetical protein PYW07_002698 [Mythimna separata]
MSMYLLTFITIVCYLYYFFTKNYNYWKARNVKGPTPIPFFGNFIDVFFRRKHVGVLFSEIYKQYPNEKVVGLYRMTSPTLLIRDLDIVKQVLIKDFDSFPDRGLYYSKQQLGDNLFHADVTVMKILRKHLTTVFTASKFKANFQVLAGRGDKFVEYLENATLKEQELNTLPAFRKYGADSIMMGAFGIDMDPYNDENNLCDLLDAAIQTPSYFLELELLFPGTLSKYNLSIFPDNVAKFCKQIIQIGSQLAAVSKFDQIRTMDVLMGLRREGNASSGKVAEGEKELNMEVTDDVLAGQVFIFYFAGYGNNSLLGTYAMYHLARNPDAQEKLVQEIKDVLRKHDENVKERHSCAMVSFGLGPRSCLGLRFAQLQFGICMVKVLSRFRVECTKNTVDKITITPMRRQHVGMLYSELYKQYPNEKVVGLYRMTSPTLLIRDLDIVKQVLIKDFDSFPDRGVYYSKKRLGDNLVHSDVTVMKVLRKHLSSVFTAGKLKANFQVLADRADKFVEYLDSETLKEPEINTLPAFRKYGIDSITKVEFGIDMDPYNDDNDFCDLLDVAIQTPSYFMELEFLFPGILLKYDLSIFPDKAAKFCQQIIEVGTTLEAVSKTYHNRIIEVLMGLRREGNVSSGNIAEGEKELWMEVTDDVLAAQVIVFYFAGYGNYTLLGTYAMYQLAKNLDVQEKLIQEIDNVLQKHGGKFSYEALKEMKYLQMVFDETLRMHPLTNSVTRNAGRDIQLDGTDLVLKKNCVLAISPYAIQHDEKYYPEPEQFKPERFSPENVKERHPCALVSFGLGPRSCIVWSLYGEGAIQVPSRVHEEYGGQNYVLTYEVASYSE